MNEIDEESVTAIKITDTPKNYSVSGYGNRLPTRYMISIGKKWYRVYAICYSNVSSFYIRMRKQRMFVDDYILDKLLLTIEE